MPEPVINPIPDRTSATRESILGMNVVFPGHPCLIAMQIMEEYETYNFATLRDDSGLLTLIENVNIKGSGASVYQTIHSLEHLMQVLHSHIGNDLASLITKNDLTLADLVTDLGEQVAAAVPPVWSGDRGRGRAVRCIATTLQASPQD